MKPKPLPRTRDHQLNSFLKLLHSRNHAAVLSSFSIASLTLNPASAAPTPPATISAVAGNAFYIDDLNPFTFVVTNDSDIRTTSDDSVGIPAQSVGGGVGLAADAVHVKNSGSIVTSGSGSHGILAQSIGGENSGTTFDANAIEPSTPTSIRFGDTGGDGAVSGNVTIDNTGEIEVLGHGAYGIYAQSVGGGGGHGAFETIISRNIHSSKAALAKSLMAVIIGGSGGSAADSGDVTINHASPITAHGDNAFGIFAQAIGGGGGNVRYSLSSPAGTAADFTLFTRLGVPDASNGTAGKVTVRATGDIHMLGKNSTAYLAQSISGGGGNAETFLDFSQRPDTGGDVENVNRQITSNVTLGSESLQDGTASPIDATHTGNLRTSAQGSTAALLQSIGGGGGNADTGIVVNTDATVDIELTLGGKNSANNHGGNITFTRTGDVLVSGNDSQGVITQSIGGGGGNLTVHVRKVPVPENSSPLAKAYAVPPTSVTTASVTLGAEAGLTSNGGAINLTSTGNITTQGQRSHAAIVQSIGGGGGKLDLTGLDQLNIALGGKSGSSGGGGQIHITHDGTIRTSGGLSHGFIIQSIGGGGGAAFTNLKPGNIALTLNSDNQGDGGDITFHQNGDIIVTGRRSIGIVAQSLGGGGGIVDRIFADTAGGIGGSGAISLTLEGNVFASGRDGLAVLAQSRAADGQGNISVVLAPDQTIYAGINGTGLKLSGGAENNFLNLGTISTADEITGMATVGTEGNDQIENYGTFYGRFDLGQGSNRFINYDGGLLIAGPELALGHSANLLINAGVMLPGNMGNAQRTRMTGSFIQTFNAVTHAELDFATNTLDSLHTTGTADLSGEVKISLLNPQLIQSGDFQKTLFSADMGVTNSGMILTTAPSAVITYDLLYTSGLAAVLDYSVDFTPQGALGRNLREVGNHISRIQDAGSSPALADTITQLLYDPTLDAYRNSLSQLAPDFYGEQQAEFIRSSQRFGELMISGGEFAAVKDGRLFWFNYENGDTTHADFADYQRVKHNSDRYTVGIQKMFHPHWTAGLGLAIDETSASGYDGRWTSEGDTTQLGSVIKGEFGATQVAAVLAYNWNSTRSSRIGQITTPFDTDIRRDMESLTGMIRVSHQFNYDGESYLRPMLDLGLTRIATDSATETGAGATSLTLPAHDEVHAWIRPSVGVGNFHSIGLGSKLHFHAEAGLQYFLTGSDTDVLASFAGAPDGVSPMSTPIDLGTSMFVTLGMDFITAKGLHLGIEYSKQAGDEYKQHIFSFKMSTPF